ncbi:AAEL012738-PA, partial [Aedes aegypti]
MVRNWNRRRLSLRAAVMTRLEKVQILLQDHVDGVVLDAGRNLGLLPAGQIRCHSRTHIHQHRLPYVDFLQRTRRGAGGHRNATATVIQGDLRFGSGPLEGQQTGSLETGTTVCVASSGIVLAHRGGHYIILHSVIAPKAVNLNAKSEFYFSFMMGGASCQRV